VNKSRAAYYKGVTLAQVKLQGEQLITEQVKQVRRIHPRMGARKVLKLITEPLQQRGLTTGRNKFFDLLRRHKLLVYRRKRFVTTTQSGHGFRVYRNLIKGWQPCRPNQVWVSDITYLRIKERFVYLFLITDAYSRTIVGWHLSKSLAIEGALSALQMALKQRKGKEALIHHSDRGIQYSCPAYTGVLKDHGISISMAAKGDCYENAIAERVNGILKGEYSLDSTYHGYDQTTQAVVSAVDLYNHYRPHWSLDLKTPAEVHNLNTILIHKSTWIVKEKRSKKENYNSSNSVN
jgi:transposase InsO family protein